MASSSSTSAVSSVFLMNENMLAPLPFHSSGSPPSPPNGANGLLGVVGVAGQVVAQGLVPAADAVAHDQRLAGLEARLRLAGLVGDRVGVDDAGREELGRGLQRRPVLRGLDAVDELARVVQAPLRRHAVGDDDAGPRVLRAPLVLRGVGELLGQGQQVLGRLHVRGDAALVEDVLAVVRRVADDRVRVAAGRRACRSRRRPSRRRSGCWRGWGTCPRPSPARNGVRSVKTFADDLGAEPRRQDPRRGPAPSPGTSLAEASTAASLSP